LKTKPKCQHRSCPPDRCEKKNGKAVAILLLLTSILLAGGLASSVSAGTAIGSKQAATPVMPPPSTIRQQIVDKTILRLARIQIANGFQTDIGLGLATDKQKQAADSPPNEGQPGQHGQFGVFDKDNSQDENYPDEGQISNDLSVQVRWNHPADWDARQLRVAIGDIKKAIVSDETTGERDKTFGGLVINIKPSRDGFVRPPDSFQVDACAVEFVSQFATESFNDYE
jgi:hypothetical protein